MPRYRSKSSKSSLKNKGILVKRKKDILYGATPYMKYRNAQILLEKYTKDPYISYTFEAKKDLSLFKVKKGSWVHERDIFEAIVISYSYEGKKGFKDLSPTTNIAMKKWLSSYLGELFQELKRLKFLAPKYIGFLESWDEIETLLSKWKHYIQINKKSENELYKPSTTEIVEYLFNWNELLRSNKVIYFEKFRHIEHTRGWVLENILRFEPTGLFTEYMYDLKFILEDKWDPEYYPRYNEEEN